MQRRCFIKKCCPDACDLDLRDSPLLSRHLRNVLFSSPTAPFSDFLIKTGIRCCPASAVAACVLNEAFSSTQPQCKWHILLFLVALCRETCNALFHYSSIFCSKCSASRADQRNSRINSRELIPEQPTMHATFLQTDCKRSQIGKFKRNI